MVSEREEQEIARVIEDFYRCLYSQVVPESNRPEKQRARVLNVGSEEIPEIDVPELRAALRQMKNHKVPGEDRTTIEMLKTSGVILDKAILILFNRRLEEGRISDLGKTPRLSFYIKKGTVRTYKITDLSASCQSFINF